MSLRIDGVCPVCGEPVSVLQTSATVCKNCGAKLIIECNIVTISDDEYYEHYA